MSIAPHPPPAEVGGASEPLDLPVHGMTCGNCVRRVERALSSLPGVQQASVNFATSRALLRYGPALIAPRAIVQAIEQVGYRVPGYESASVDAKGPTEPASEPPPAAQRAPRAPLCPIPAHAHAPSKKPSAPSNGASGATSRWPRASPSRVWCG